MSAFSFLVIGEINGVSPPLSVSLSVCDLAESYGNSSSIDFTRIDKSSSSLFCYNSAALRTAKLLCISTDVSSGSI